MTKFPVPILPIVGIGCIVLGAWFFSKYGPTEKESFESFAKVVCTMDGTEVFHATTFGENNEKLELFDMTLNTALVDNQYWMVRLSSKGKSHDILVPNDAKCILIQGESI